MTGIHLNCKRGLIILCPCLAILNEPKGAEIWLDHVFVGSVPAKLKLTAVQRLIVIKIRGRADWIRSIAVQKDSEVTLQPELP